MKSIFIDFFFFFCRISNFQLSGWNGGCHFSFLQSFFDNQQLWMSSQVIFIINAARCIGHTEDWNNISLLFLVQTAINMEIIFVEVCVKQV